MTLSLNEKFTEMAITAAAKAAAAMMGPRKGAAPKSGGRVRAAQARGKRAGALSARKSSAAAARLAPTVAPVAVSYPGGPLVHKVLKQTAETCLMQGRSYIGDVVSTSGSGLAVSGVFSLHPVLFQDRLSAIAQTYDKYVYKKVKLCYVPYANTSTAGQVHIYLERDYLDPLPDNKISQIASNYAYARDQPWKNMEVMLTRDPTEKRTYFTLTGVAQVPETEQFKAVTYCDTPHFLGTLGQLYLDYEIEFVSPTFSVREQAYAENFIRPFNTGRGLIASPNSSFLFTADAGTPFLGIPIGNAARVWEVVVFDVGTNLGRALPNLVWQRQQGPQFIYASSVTLYAVTAFYEPGGVSKYCLFNSYADAMAGDTSAALFNINTGGDSTALLDGCWVSCRQLTQTPQAFYG